MAFSTSKAHAAMVYSGVAAGDATETSIILWTRVADSTTQTCNQTPLTAQLSVTLDFKAILKPVQGKTDPNRDCILKLDVQGLQPGTRYFYRFQTADGALSPTGIFKTAPLANVKVAVRFGFSGDTHGQWRPFPLGQQFAKQPLDFFIFLGDTVYETKTPGSPAIANPFTDPKQALQDYRRKYRENLEPVKPQGWPSLQPLFSNQGHYTLYDNHELGNKQFINGGAAPGTPPGKGVDPTDSANDVNTSGQFINKTEGFKALAQAYLDYHPIRESQLQTPEDPRANGTPKLYFAQKWGANSIFINVDTRSYRDIRLKTSEGADDTGARADHPQRTMLGTSQKTWLKQTLLDAQRQGIPWKVVATSSPMDEVGPNPFGADGGKTWTGGYKAERQELLKFIADNNIRNVVFLTTDDHQLRVNELTYFPDPKTPTSRVKVPHAFSIVAGPFGAGGPDRFVGQGFSFIKSVADSLVASQTAKGIDPLGLDPKFPGLQKVFRDADSTANVTRQPIAFYSPDTFNYVALEVSADGKTLSVKAFGIDAYSPNTFPEPSPTVPIRQILGFQVQAF